MLETLVKACLDLVYPPKCPGCGKAVAEHGQWCPLCLGPVLSLKALSPVLHRLKHLAGCFVVCQYGGAVRHLLQDIKFHGEDNKQAALAWLLTQAAGTVRFAGIDAVVPVPLHPKRRRERGYNQTELLFSSWSRKQGFLWLPDVLLRERETLPQWELPSNERRKNIRGAFRVQKSNLIQGKRILLVDDIFTTGATMDECAKTLLAVGAEKVEGLALASSSRG